MKSFRVRLLICSTFRVCNEFLLSFYHVLHRSIFLACIKNNIIQGRSPFSFELLKFESPVSFCIPMKMIDNCIFFRQNIELMNDFAIGISEWKFTQCDPVRVRDGASNNLAMCQLLLLAAYQRGFTK